MAEPSAARAAKLLVDQAWAASKEGRYREAVAAAARAVEAAEQLDDPVLLVLGLSAEANTLRLLGDHSAALARCTRILGLAGDPATSGGLDAWRAAKSVADAHWSWVECALYLTGIPVRELFGVLDAAERWLAATGHLDWRASVLSARALVHETLEKTDAALAAREEALALRIQHPDAPGYTLNTCRIWLGSSLRGAGRAPEAVPHYQAVLADPAAGPWDRRAAHVGLARYALAAHDPQTARREARTAVLLAEPLGDNALCSTLDVLTQACRATETSRRPGTLPPGTLTRPGGSAATTGPTSRSGRRSTSPWIAATCPPPGGC